VADQEFNLNQ